MARVVLATLRGAGGFEKKLVVKQIRDELAFDQQFVRRFVEEAKTTVALSHPNIVPVYELGVEQGTYFLAMELVEGVSVAELLRERNEDGSRRVLTPEEGAYVGMEVCRALDYAHRRMKVVHRDITPRNVMIDEEGQIKLIDFGIAAPALVAGHEILGSPGHMAPEQVDGGQLGPSTDIFAVAVLLMEAWTGSAPFRRATPEECAAAVREPHPRPSDFDARLLPLDEQIMRAMNVNPAERQQEASELARALRLYLQGIDVADLARTLGDRVRDLREAASSPSPPSGTGLPRPSAASHGDLGTKTFAARDEAMSWSSFPPPPSGSSGVVDVIPIPPPSTRQLPDSINKIPAVRANRGRADDPAMSIPTPLMVEADELSKIHKDIDRARAEKAGQAGLSVATPPSASTPVASRASDAPAAPTPLSPRIPQADIPTMRRPRLKKPLLDQDEKLETIATRPIETPVGGFNPRQKTPPDKSKATLSRLVTTGLIIAVLGLGGALAWRMKSSASTSTTNTPTQNPTSSSASLPTSTSPSTAVSIALPPPGTTDSSKKLTPSVPASSPAATPTSSQAVAAGKATIALVGDPGTRVWVDGASKGSCPQRVTVESGSHEVKFTFDPTGESLVERVTTKPNDHLTVRAQFTGATPTVKTQR